MEPEGMVHALEEIHRLLRPGGLLIDLRPTLAATRLEVHCGGAITFSAPVPGETFFGTQSADEAMARVIDGGLFAPEQAMEFDWRTYAWSVAELREHIAAEQAYEDQPTPELLALQEGELAQSLQEALAASGEGALVARMYPGRMARLRRLRG
jgi:hypothetical protein